MVTRSHVLVCAPWVVQKPRKENTHALHSSVTARYLRLLGLLVVVGLKFHQRAKHTLVMVGVLVSNEHLRKETANHTSTLLNRPHLLLHSFEYRVSGRVGASVEQHSIALHTLIQSPKRLLSKLSSCFNGTIFGRSTRRARKQTRYGYYRSTL